MMETMVQTGLDGDHGTVMAMMDTMALMNTIPVSQPNSVLYVL